MSEEWKQTDFCYEVSNFGRIRNKEGKVIKGQTVRGYHHVNLFDGDKYHRKRVNRLVARAFIGEIESGLQVDHKNGIRDDNRVSNLEIVSCRENIARAYARNGRKRDLPLGVQLLKGNRKKKYQACIRVKGKFINLGTFSDKHEAHMKYLAYKENLNGE